MGDGAWADWAHRRLHKEITSTMALMSETTSPAVSGLPMSRESGATALIDHISNTIPSFIPSFRQIFDYSARHSLGLTALKKLYSYIAGKRAESKLSSVTLVANASDHGGPPARFVWLPQVQFLNSVTRSPTLNNMIIDAFEGQLITLVVVIAFILIFLIREWVIQQQPIINGGHNHEAQIARNAEVPAQGENGEERPQAAEGEAVGEPDNEHQPDEPRARIIARARLRRPRVPRRASEQQGPPDESDALIQDTDSTTAQAADSPPTSPQSDPSTQSMADVPLQRPNMPHRNTLARAAEIRRIIEEHSRDHGVNDFAIATFINLWEKAGKRPLEVIRIVEEEGRTEELAWIVTAMQNIENHRSALELARNDVPSPSLESKAIAPDITQSKDQGQDTSDNRPPQIPDPEVRLENNDDANSQHLPSSDSTNSDPSVSDAILPNRSTAQVKPIKVPWARSGSPSLDPRLSEVPAEGRRDGSISDNSIRSPPGVPIRPESSASNNTFHPEHEGDLGTTSQNPSATAPDETINHRPGTTQPIQDTARANNAPVQAPPIHEVPNRHRRLMELIMEWLWGGVAPVPPAPEQPAGDEERIVGNIADEAPFVPVDHGQPLRLAANDRAVANQDPEVVAAAIQAGVDPNQADAADEIEDLEGIMELIGMQGPLAGLVQNGMFCACLVSLTVIVGVWIPYIVGKMFLVLLAHPTSILFRIPFRWATSTADVIIDTFTFILGCTIYWTDTLFNIIWIPVTWLMPSLSWLSQDKVLADTARSYAESALGRLGNSAIATGDVLSETDLPMLSILAHESLRSMEAGIASTLRFGRDHVLLVFKTAHDSTGIVDFSTAAANNALEYLQSLQALLIARVPLVKTQISSIAHFNPLQVKLTFPQRTAPIDYDLAQWDFRDRALAVLFGYLFFALSGAAYLRIHAWMKDSNRAGRVAGGVADALYQASGVMKVVLIISIEMLVFPLYCGLLLDIALLPLFGGATMMSRLNFTLSYPMTSLFIHWFVGTCYMFHFALFVSLCRKILRRGVLCKSISYYLKT